MCIVTRFDLHLLKPPHFCKCARAQAPPCRLAVTHWSMSGLAPGEPKRWAAAAAILSSGSDEGPGCGARGRCVRGWPQGASSAKAWRMPRRRGCAVFLFCVVAGMPLLRARTRSCAAGPPWPRLLPRCHSTAHAPQAGAPRSWRLALPHLAGREVEDVGAQLPLHKLAHLRRPCSACSTRRARRAARMSEWPHAAIWRAQLAA